MEIVKSKFFEREIQDILEFAKFTNIYREIRKMQES